MKTKPLILNKKQLDNLIKFLKSSNPTVWINATLEANNFELRMCTPLDGTHSDLEYWLIPIIVE